MAEIIPLASAIVAGVFTATLGKQYLSRRKFHQLVWTLSMGLFAFGAFLEFVMSLVAVTGPLFDVYYLSIGPQVGLLGTGVVYLLRPRIGKYVLYSVITLTAGLVISVLVWPVDISGSVLGFPGPIMTYQQWFEASTVYGIYFAVAAFADIPRTITQIMNSLGAILVVGGGFLSFVVDRKRYYALMIAAGALMNAVGGILLGILNDPDVFLYFELIGIVFLYLGFLMSSRFVVKRDLVTSAPSPVPSPASPQAPVS